MHTDTLGCVWPILKNFGNFKIIGLISTVFWCFRAILDKSFFRYLWGGAINGIIDFGLVQWRSKYLKWFNQSSWALELSSVCLSTSNGALGSRAGKIDEALKRSSGHSKVLNKRTPFVYGCYLCLWRLPLFTVFTFVYGVYLCLRSLPLFTIFTLLVAHRDPLMCVQPASRRFLSVTSMFKG